VGGVDLVDHQVDNDAGDGDVEPKGEGPAGDEAMLIEFFEEGAAKGGKDERNDDDGKDGVRGEQGEVDGTDPALALEVDHFPNADVVDDVGDEERAGDEEGGEHEFLVEFAFTGTDGGVATGEEDCADAVECGIEGGLGEHESVTFRLSGHVKGSQ
jgi:hypothetical protein